MPPQDAADTSLRLLVVAYYFPPSGGAGVQRVLKWVKYLSEFEIAPTVLTVRQGAYPETDSSLAADMPPGTPVVRTASMNPMGLYARLTGRRRSEAIGLRTDHVGSGGSLTERLSRLIRANLFIPDGRVGWVPFAAIRARKLHRDAPFDAVLTSGPPHSVHLVGLALAREGVPWIADFRDPWTDIHYLAHLPRTRMADRLDHALERRVLNTADAVVTVSPSWGKMLGERGRGKIHVIPNGFDEDDFAAAERHMEPNRFVIAHVGSLYDSRNPTALWEALERLRERSEVERLVVRIVGRVGEGVKADARSRNVPVEWVEYKPHAAAVAEMQAADLLVLATEPHEREQGHLTGKLYEYLASGRPVVGLGTPVGDAATLLEKTGGGRMFRRDDAAGIAAFIAAAYQSWAVGERPAGAHRDALAPYTRRRLTDQLAKVLRDVVTGGRQ